MIYDVKKGMEMELYLLQHHRTPQQNSVSAIYHEVVLSQVKTTSTDARSMVLSIEKVNI